MKVYYVKDIYLGNYEHFFHEKVISKKQLEELKQKYFEYVKNQTKNITTEELEEFWEEVCCWNVKEYEIQE